MIDRKWPKFLNCFSAQLHPDKIMSHYQINAYPGTHEQIEELALFVREKLQEQLKEKFGSAVNGAEEFLRKAVEFLGGNIQISDDPSTVEESGGSLVIYPDRTFTIFLSPYTSVLRDNFTTGHELGHFFLHYPHKNPPPHSVTFARYGSNLIEWQANRFSAAFLMPRDEFKRISSENNRNPDLIAQYFDVSKAAVEVRLQYIS